jgi:hypothetical protein
MSGKSRERRELADTSIPLEAPRIAVLPCRGGEPPVRKLFEPLRNAVTALRHPLDPKFPDWGESPYFTVPLKAMIRLTKRSLALYEFAFGIEALERFVRQSLRNCFAGVT